MTSAKNQFSLEALEPRLLLSADALVATAPSQAAPPAVIVESASIDSFGSRTDQNVGAAESDVDFFTGMKAAALDSFDAHADSHSESGLENSGTAADSTFQRPDARNDAILEADSAGQILFVDAGVLDREALIDP